MVIRRGAIVWSALGPAIGSEPAKTRPVIVVQSDALNESVLATVMVAVITSNTSLAARPGNVFLPATATGLPKDSVVNVTQCTAVDRARIGGFVSQLPGYLMSEVDAGLRLVLDL